MPSRKAVALGLFALFVAYAVWLLYKAEAIADAMFDGSLGTSLFLYLLVNPAYIIIILGVTFIHRDRILRGFLAGVAFTTALDILSLPRLPRVLPVNADGMADLGLLASNHVVVVNSDLIIAKAALGF